jgi:hypothetical protein
VATWSESFLGDSIHGTAAGRNLLPTGFAFESEWVEGALCNGRANKYEYVILTFSSSIVFSRVC